MPADANIFQQYLQPPRSIQSFASDLDRADLTRLQLEGQRRQNALSALTFQQNAEQSRQAQEKLNALQRVYSSLPATATPIERARALQANPYTAQEGVAAEKAILENEKTVAGTEKDRAEAAAKAGEEKRRSAELMKGLSGVIMSSPSQLTVRAVLDHYAQVTGQPVDKVAAIFAQAGDNPEAIKRLAAGFALQAEKMLPQIQTRNTGGTTDTLAIDPLTGKPTVTGSVTNTVSPDARLSAETTMRGQNLTDKRERDLQGSAVTYQQDADGNFVALPTRAAPGAMIRGVPVAAPGGGLQPLQGKSSGLTEDQGKATGWLVQANNAWANMQKAMKADPSAAMPGVNDAIAAIPSAGLGGAVANTFRGAERQKFMQAASSLSESLLRAATGAGVNKDEAVQKVREITPVWGDDEATVKQKMDAIPLYIESLKVRAGPGAKKAAAVAAPAPDGSFDGFKILGVK